MEILATTGYVLLCILLFSLAIAIHEFGHFVVALKLGLRVERFSLGFGPAIWKRRWRGVEYRLSWIPFGGYVMIPDIDPEGTKVIEGGGDEKRRVIAPWKEILVAVAGPAMNVVFAIAVAVVLSLVPGVRFGVLPTTIGSVLPGGPAEKAGIRVGDRVVSVAGREVDTWSAMLTELQILGPREGEIVVERGGERVALTILPERDPATDAVLIAAKSVPREGGVPGAWLPARNPWAQIRHDAGAIFRVLKALATPKEMKETSKGLMGPVGIAQGIYGSLRADFWNGLGFLRFLNVNLAVLNLLPIPVLDGGLVLFALIALVFRRRVPAKIVNALSMAFMFLLLGLMGVLVYRDSARAWRIRHVESKFVRALTAPDVSDDSDKTRDEAPEGR